MAALTLAPHAKLCCPKLFRLRQAVQPQSFVAARRCAAKHLTTCSAAESATMASSPASPQYSALVGKQVLITFCKSVECQYYWSHVVASKSCEVDDRASSFKSSDVWTKIQRYLRHGTVHVSALSKVSRKRYLLSQGRTTCLLRSAFLSWMHRAALLRLNWSALGQVCARGGRRCFCRSSQLSSQTSGQRRMLLSLCSAEVWDDSSASALNFPSG